MPDLCRLESGAEWSTPLIWNQGEQPWVLTLSGHQGVPGGGNGGVFCFLERQKREREREGGRASGGDALSAQFRRSCPV